MAGAPFATRHHDLHLDVLKSELIVNQSEQLDGARVRHMGAPDLDASAFPRQLRMRLGAFAIQQEGGVSVKTFLQIVQALVRTVPGIGLIHNQDGVIRFRVVPDQVDHADPGLIFERLWFTFQAKDWLVDVGR